MNKVQIDFSHNQPVFSNTVVGYIGEHNATTLTVIPPYSMTENSSIINYVIAFLTEDGQKYHSETFSKSSNIEFSLCSQLTTGNILYVQLEGHGENKNIIAKSEIIFLRFGNSLSGKSSMVDSNAKPQENIIQIGWMPDNKNILSGISWNEEFETLSYNGKCLVTNDILKATTIPAENVSYTITDSGISIEGEGRVVSVQKTIDTIFSVMSSMVDDFVTIKQVNEAIDEKLGVIENGYY